MAPSGKTLVSFKRFCKKEIIQLYKPSRETVQKDYYLYKNYDTSKIKEYERGREYVDRRKFIKMKMKAFVKTGEI